MDLYNLYRQRKLKEMFNTSDIIQSGDKLISNTIEGVLPGVPQFMVFHSEHGGVGKTTVGRIFASELNPDKSELEEDSIFSGKQNPYFYEINAGNYRKIDDVRALDAKVKYQSDMTIPHNIIYMINEAHQLTGDAQQVFLQMVENLPAHIRIIFTTTDLGSIDEKLLSRAKLYRFQSIDKDDMRKLLLDIAARAGASVIPEYITDQLYEMYGHSIRKCINELESYLSTGKVAGGEPDKEESPALRTVIDDLLNVAAGEKISWSKKILPNLRTVMSSMSAVEARVKFALSLQYVLMTPGNVTMSGLPLLAKMTEEFSESSALPPMTDIMFKFLRLYAYAMHLGRQASGGNNAGDSQ